MADDETVAGVQLPYMEEEDLEAFIAANPELALSDAEVLYLRLRRRRLSVRRRRGADAGRADRVKLVAVGDDAAAGKEAGLRLWHRNAGPGGPVPIACRVVRAGGEAEALPPVVETWVPEAAAAHRPVRSLLYSAAHAFLVFFSIAQRGTFERVRDVWVPEIRAHMAAEGEDAPILLIGNDADQREAAPAAALVAADEAIALAQEVGAAKYIEVHHLNVLHMEEVVSQALQAVARRYGGDLPDGAADREALEAFLTTPAPMVEVDETEGVLRCRAAGDGEAQLLYTLDGSEPSLHSAVYTAPLPLRPPLPSRVRVRAVGRCQHPSDVVTVVPEASAAPRGAFDPFRPGAFMVDAAGDGRPRTVHYTLDGTLPTSTSLCADGATPLAVPPDAPCVTLVAREPGKLPSAAVAHPVPARLAPPRATIVERVLHVAAADPGVVCRYTLDGTPPSYDNGSEYRDPVPLPAGVSVADICVAAFPRLAYPSSAVGVVPSAAPEPADRARGGAVGRRTPPLPCEGSQARSSLARDRDASSVANTSLASSTRSRRSPSPRRSRSRSGGRAPLSSIPIPSHSTRQSRGSTGVAGPAGSKQPRGASQSQARSSQARDRDASSVANTSLASSTRSRRSPSPRSGSGSGRRGSAPRRSGGSPAPPPCTPHVSCSPADSALTFAFAAPISVSHLTVSTPGGGHGPESYTVAVQPPGASAFTPVGSGALRDVNGVQVLAVPRGAGGAPAVGVRVDFAKAGGKVFRVSNVRIHGRPAAAPMP
eukprot:TRINITY_DN3881_c0_g1_i1.p1 TRINITY_DN3881_c0_g1~~TRINITY_DN3881_c0_g1_i1.p1  ORF type:complete len:789 (+),score=193.59 TRINITY_DN3881_c0_g1_i1:72-2369(+)